MLPESVRIVSRPTTNDVFLVFYYANGHQCSLQWRSDLQSFLPVASILTSSHNEELRVIEAAAVFGALPLGEYHTALLYIVQTQQAATLPCNHTVMEIKGMDVLLLPAKAVPPAVPTAAVPSTPMMGGDAQRSSSPAPLLPLPRSTLGSYLCLLRKFATAKDPHGGSRMYFSRTARLALPTIRDVVNELLVVPSSTTSSSEQSSTTLSEDHTTLHRMPSLSGLQGATAEAVENLHLWNGAHWRGSFPSSIVEYDEELNVSYEYLPQVVRGFIGEVVQSPVVSKESGNSKTTSEELHVVLMGRLSSQRAGTRYNRRGIDRVTGTTANFAETSQVVFTTRSTESGSVVTTSVSAYTVLRGSVPFLWEQPADLTLKPAIRLDQMNAASDFTTHVALLANLYSAQCKTIHCIDTLSRSKLEAPLSDTFAQAVKTHRARVEAGEIEGRDLVEVEYQRFDVGRNLHVHRRYHDLQATLLSHVDGPAERFGLSVWQTTLVDTDVEEESHGPPRGGWSQQSTQQGMFRVNCLDCLDRTNLTQSMLCLHMLTAQLEGSSAVTTIDGVTTISDDLEQLMRELWAEHGKAFSQLYAGTQPHFLDILVDKHRSLWSSRYEPFIAIRRFIQQNFFDGNKQDAVSLVTGSHNTRTVTTSTLVDDPFECRLTSLNRFLAAGFALSVCAMTVNSLLMLRYERYRLRFDFVAFQLMWSCLLGTVSYHIRKDPFSFTNFSVLH